MRAHVENLPNKIPKKIPAAARSVAAGARDGAARRLWAGCRRRAGAAQTFKYLKALRRCDFRRLQSDFCRTRRELTKSL
jgi:hypothetical protein